MSHPEVDATAALATAINAWCDAVLVSLGSEDASCNLVVAKDAAEEYSITAASIEDILARGFNEVNVSAPLYEQEQRLYARDVLEQVVSDVSTKLNTQVKAVSNARRLAENGAAGSSNLATAQSDAELAVDTAIATFETDEADAECSTASGIFSTNGVVTSTCSDAQKAALLVTYNDTLHFGGEASIVQVLEDFECAIIACDALDDCDHTSSVEIYNNLIADLIPAWSDSVETQAAGFPGVYDGVAVCS